jgi:hypothetical protein
MMDQFRYNYPIKTKHHNQTVRRYTMQGSFGEATERFRGKQQDTSKSKENRKERNFRDKRRNRHQDAE